MKKKYNFENIHMPHKPVQNYIIYISCSTENKKLSCRWHSLVWCQNAVFID